jgi:multidrug efflux pump subunit AcrA (membrane-fusion protein)
MSNLGKIFLYLALVGALVAVVFGVLLNQEYNQTKVNLAQTQQAKAASDKATAQAKAETATVTAAKADSDAKLATATSKIDDLNTQLTAAQKTAADATTAVATANTAAKTAQDALDAIKKTLGDETPEQYLADKNKAQADLTAAQSEQKILQDQLQASQTQIADLKDAINRSKTGTIPPGVSGKVTFVDRTWNFVVLDVGLSNGVVPNGELIVYRGRTFLGKVRVTKADPNDAVAEILPNAKGDIQIGDSVLN